MLYYFGRIEGHMQNSDIEKVIFQQISVMTPTEYRIDAERCGNALTTAGANIVAIGACSCRKKKGA